MGSLVSLIMTRRFLAVILVAVVGFGLMGTATFIDNTRKDALNKEFSTKLEQEYGATSNKNFTSIYNDIGGKGSLETPVTFTRDGVDTKVLVKNMSDDVTEKVEVAFLTLDEKLFYPKKEE